MLINSFIPTRIHFLRALVNRPLSATVMAMQTTAASDSIFQKKRALRSRVRRELKAFDPIQRQQEDEAVQDLVLKAPWFKSCSRLCAYISCESLREVSTSKIVSTILDKPKSGYMEIPKKLYVPRVEDKESNMRMLHITSSADLVANSMNILEPTMLDNNGNQRENVLQADEPVDLLLLPGLAFDLSGRRLGRGGGYYDLFLKNYLELTAKRGWQPPLLVALTYSKQILDEPIPVSPHDVLIDALVSPSGILFINAEVGSAEISIRRYAMRFIVMGLSHASQYNNATAGSIYYDITAHSDRMQSGVQCDMTVSTMPMYLPGFLTDWQPCF